ncbi:PHO85 cyclin-5 [Elasticomyces elasticus]|nr:PHO85 cyclin-5 [Elasticomyces elasticus]KAK4975222.1 PHO85 cyclin-5 [Elasticomyces elasticus]
MRSALVQSRFDGFQLPIPQSCGPYESSIASSASSQDSIFSDLGSTQSSVASSISDDFRSIQEDTRHRWLSHPADAGYGPGHDQRKLHCLLRAQQGSQAPTYADVTSVPSEHRQHPRRSSTWERKQKPPPLVRQCERKLNFVDNLVDSATQMVEVIWPLSVVPCRTEGSKRGVLPLRVYIEETLRRSRTSYSTLQVALYYLILIKPFVPKNDFTMEQESDCPAARALMCGRRMFLSALILASKYLQDRNYSAKAWSKMSGLPVNEININERTFLSKVCWKLHIPEPIFKRWTDVVLKYTPSMHPPSPGQPGFGLTWTGIIPLLTPELDRVPLSEMPTPPTLQCPANYGLPSPTTPMPTKDTINPMLLVSTSPESTPTPLTVLPRFLEPALDIAPPTPALARMGPLPTPLMTPSTYGSNTPAASVFGYCRPSIHSAMAMAQKAGINRCTIDSYPGTVPSMDQFCQSLSRRPSISTISSGSSPESMVSDRTRSSRASSISSVSTVSTTSSLAPQRACLARQATCRNAGRLPMLPAVVREEMEGSAVKPIVIDDNDMTSSPEVIDFTISDKAMHAPHRHSKHAPQHHGQVAAAVSSTEKTRKRARPRGGRRSDLEDEIRFQLEEGLDVMEIDSDRENVSPSPAAEYASKMLSRSNSALWAKTATDQEESRPVNSLRVPLQKLDGKKRVCAMSISPAPSGTWTVVS